MNNLYTFLVALILFVTFSSCQRELHFPEPEPVNQFSVVVDGITYNLEIENSVTNKGTIAHVEILAKAPQVSVRLVSKSENHNNGVGEYYLACCHNDIFDRTEVPQKHWEMNRAGSGRQKGGVTITKWNDKVLEGTYNMTGQVGTARNAPVKEFTGKFTIYF